MIIPNGHYMHSLVRRNVGDGVGWYAPAELKTQAATGFGYAVPVGHQHKLFGVYNVDIGIMKEGTLQEVQTMSLELSESKTLRLSFFKVAFVERKVFPTCRLLKYRGRLLHPDFELPLVEVVAQSEEQIEELFVREHAVILGCIPTRYGGFEEIIGRGKE